MPDKIKETAKKDVIETVLDDFLSRLAKEKSLETTILPKLKELAKSKDFSMEKLKAALFAEDKL
ncbi:MAG TPA: hypothetical protein VGK01_15120 [Candidatus Angelobacter sp.]|jgi:hypothetical protein